MVIWANHILRARARGDAQASRRIHEEQSLAGVEGAIASVRDVFAITANAELEEAERRYSAPPRRPRVS